ncbi:MAG: response regulator [Pseudomonadota bacterium]|nr:response regulator [Pseudomonadota bacterium]
MIKTILIVDDSPVARKIMRSCLPKDRAFVVVEAGDGLQGLQLFQSESPDLTFIDLTMPVMNGVEALKRMKEINPQAVVVVASADIQPKTVAMVMSLGAFSMLRKPISRESVAEAIRRVEEPEGAN